MKKLVLILLASLLLTGCAATATDDTSDTKAQTDADNANSTETTEADPYADSLPDGLDFEGKTIRFYNGKESRNKYFEGPEESSGDIVEDAVLERNHAVEERLNVDVIVNGFEKTHAEMPTEISKLILAGDSTYDMFYGHQLGITKLLTENYFVNASDVDYIDLDKPYYNKEYMEELTLGNDNFFYIVSDYNIEPLIQLRVAFYNKELYGNVFGSQDGLYEIVLDGKWTIDKMSELISTVYVDVNNDGNTDAGDTVGHAIQGLFASVDGFVYGADVDFTKRDSDGMLSLNIVNEKSVILAEKLNKLFHQPGTLNLGESPVATFKSGSALFLGNGTFVIAEELRDMETEFGFLPHPKLDESQDDYRSLVHDTVLLGAIPSNSENLDIVGAVLEALSSESRKTVIPAWYETALKVKYTRDDISSQMIDLIHDSMTTNFIYAYSATLGNVGHIYRTVVSSNSNDFASAYAKVEPTAVAGLEELTSILKK